MIQMKTQMIQELFEAHGYKKQPVRRLHREATQSCGARPVNEARGHRGQRAEREQDGFLNLPYIDECVCAKVNSIVKKSTLNLRVDWWNNNTVRNCLVRSTFHNRSAPSVRGFVIPAILVWKEDAWLQEWSTE